MSFMGRKHVPCFLRQSQKCAELCSGSEFVGAGLLSKHKGHPGGSWAASEGEQLSAPRTVLWSKCSQERFLSMGGGPEGKGSIWGEESRGRGLELQLEKYKRT